MGLPNERSPQDKRRPSARRKLTAAGTIFGIFAGALLGTVFDSAITDSSILIAALCALTILSLLVFSGVLLRLATESADRHEDLTRQLETLRQTIGQTVGHQLIVDLNAGLRSMADEPVTRAVQSARSEILVLDIVESSGGRPAHSMRDDLLQQFLDGLLDHVETTSTVTYHRICQVTNPRSKLPTASGAYHSHLLAMLRNRASGQYRFSLKVAKLRHPFKFVLVDRRFLMLQLNRHDSAGHREAWSELLFWEAEPALVSAFYSMWCDVDSEARTRVLTEADIAGPSSNGRSAPVPKVEVGTAAERPDADG